MIKCYVDALVVVVSHSLCHNLCCIAIWLLCLFFPFIISFIFLFLVTKENLGNRCQDLAISFSVHIYMSVYVSLQLYCKVKEQPLVSQLKNPVKTVEICSNT